MDYKQILKDFSIDTRALQMIKRAGSILAIGSSDSGKTTLLRALINTFAGQKRALIDLDTGQSRLGPPTTIGWTVIPAGAALEWETAETRDLFFTGTLSPVGNMLITLAGSKLVFDRARQASDKVFIDTSGLIGEGPGWALKEQKIELLRPDLILALERDDELEPLLLNFRRAEYTRILRLKIHAEVRKRSMAERTIYRKDRFRTYFNDAEEQVLNWDDVALRGTALGKAAPFLKHQARLEKLLGVPVLYMEGEGHVVAACDGNVYRERVLKVKRQLGLRGLHLLNIHDLKGQIVGLRDAQGIDKAIGILVSMDWKNRTLTILSPRTFGPASIVFGKTKLPYFLS